ADLDAAAAHLVDGRDYLRQRARMAERHGRHEHAQPEPVGVPRQPGDDRPGVGRRPARRAREALVVVGAEERLDAVRLGALGDREVTPLAHALVWRDKEGKALRSSMIVNPPLMIQVDEIVRGCMIVRVTRSMTQAVESTATTEAIIADVRSFLGELKCVGSE